MVIEYYVTSNKMSKQTVLPLEGLNISILLMRYAVNAVVADIMLTKCHTCGIRCR
jgi:hypothetical protein